AAISDPVIVYGADCRVQRANPAARRLFKSGAVGEDIVAVCGHLDARDMEGRPATAEEIAAWRGALAGRIVAGRRYSATTPDGEHLVLEPVVAPLHHGDRVTGAVGVWRDVTDRERLIADLGASNAALAESHRRKDEFLAMLGHELRNPLGAISTAARAIRLLLERSEDVEPSLAILERQVGSAARLLEDLLDVSRITRGLIHLRKEVVSLGAIVGQVAETQRAAIDVAGHRLSVVTPLEPVTVEGDPTRLEQIAANLLNNAVKYTPTGGSIEVEVESSDDRALLKVRDTGVGIAPDLLPHVFDLFVQGETTLARSQGGLGIGLTLVRRLVELHGGTIEAHSAGRGAGSEFVVTLPEVRRGLPAVSPPKATPVAGARILLVEDNVDAADVLSEYLRASGHQVAVAHDGEAALCRAAECFPDIVLLDIGLPGIDGYEVARRLRANISERVPYVIALSGYAQEDDMRRSQEAGCALHLTKPVSAEVLDQAIAGALESVPPAVPDQGMSS
ncbi:MAG TPA: ATP-binding protein, partial [Anaeromyxobacteraceae bacterium]|nr:ATP-binding protein [Anaeromyxobacteraceae bacterium]